MRPNKRIIADLIYELEKAKACTSRNALISALYVLQNIYNVKLGYNYDIVSYGMPEPGYQGLKGLRVDSPEAWRDIENGRAELLWSRSQKGTHVKNKEDDSYEFNFGLSLTHRTEDHVRKASVKEIKDLVNYLKGKSEWQVLDSVKSHFLIKEDRIGKGEKKEFAEDYKVCLLLFKQIEELRPKKEVKTFVMHACDKKYVV